MSFKITLISILALFIAGCSATGDESSSSTGDKFLPIVVGDGSGTVAPGEEAQISWEVTADQPSTVYIEATYDGGKTWHLVESDVVNSGKYDFTVVNIPGAEFRIRVVGVDAAVIAESETTTIKGETPAIAIADGKNSFTSGQPIQLTWETNSDQPNEVKLQQSLDNGVTFTDVETIANTGSHTVTAPSTAGTLVLRIIDPEKGLVLAQTGVLNVVSGFPGVAVTSGGGTASSQSYSIHAAIEPIQGQVLKDSQGVVRAEVNLIGVTE